MAKLFANSGDPDQTPHSVAADLGLHCLPSTFLQVSILQWVKIFQKFGHLYRKEFVPKLLHLRVASGEKGVKYLGFKVTSL